MNNEMIKPTIPEGWTEWAYSDAKPYPETLDTFVEILFADGEFIDEGINPETVEFWQDGVASIPNSWKTDDNYWKIIAYKVAKDN